MLAEVRDAGVKGYGAKYGPIVEALEARGLVTVERGFRKSAVYHVVRPTSGPWGSGTSREFVTGILRRTDDQSWVLESPAGIEKVEVDQRSARIPCDQSEPWIVTRSADSEYPVVKLNLHESNRARAQRRREAKDADLERRAGPVEHVSCPSCGDLRPVPTDQVSPESCDACRSGTGSDQESYPDDREPDRSIRAWFGGAPGLGRRR